MAFVDVVLLGVVGKHAGLNLDSKFFLLITTVSALVIAVVQLSIYNMLDGPSGGPGERIAHYFEFSFEILSALISFSFCMDNKLLCDRKIRQILVSQQTTSSCRDFP